MLGLLNRQDLLTAYTEYLGTKSRATIDAYTRAVRQFVLWLTQRPGYGEEFHPDQLTRAAVETYLTHLETTGCGIAHRTRVKSAISSFATWLIDEKDWLRRNPTRGIVLPAQQLLAPRQLSPDQRLALRHLAERAENTRGSALFALGYWAGCRVSDVAWLRLQDTHVTRKAGWVRVGFKGGKVREIDLVNEARGAVYEYIEAEKKRVKVDGNAFTRTYLFTSQRQERLTEAGIHHWFRALKARATKAEWELLHDITYHDLRHDFAHRAREAGWSLEEVAYYLGHVTKKGTPAITTTARYTQVSRYQVRAKLRDLRG